MTALKPRGKRSFRMADGDYRLTQIGSVGAVAKRSSRSMAMETAKERWCIEPVPIAPKPPHLQRITHRAHVEMRKANRPEDADVIRDFWQWQFAYCLSINENASRLRGAQWCYRELICHADAEAQALAVEVLGVLKTRWGLYDVPMDRCECDRIARETALTMARAETRRPKELT